jgi:hypothetical protein
VEDHLFILGLNDAQAPVLHHEEQEIIFTYKPEEQPQTTGYQNQVRYAKNEPRQVSIAFGHEQYRILHGMDRSPDGVFFYYFDYPESLLDEMRTIEYRYVVDGVWMRDAKNPNQRQLLSGIRISQVALPEPPLVPLKTPVVLAGDNTLTKEVRFIFQAPQDNLVYIAGSFNEWDPFLHRLREVHPGIYSTTIRLRPGIYYYYFVTGGRRITDPLNPELGANSEGLALSKLIVPQ